MPFLLARPKYFSLKIFRYYLQFYTDSSEIEICLLESNCTAVSSKNDSFYYQLFMVGGNRSKRLREVIK